MKEPTVESALLVERLKWLREQANNPEEHAQMNAAVFGHFEMLEKAPTLLPNGMVHPLANPWAKQTERDLQILRGADYKGILDKGWKEKITDPDFDIKENFSAFITSTEAMEQEKMQKKKQQDKVAEE